MVGDIWGRWSIVFMFSLLLPACAAHVPVPQPQANRAGTLVDPAPFALIFDSNPETQNGAGALPTAETAVARAITTIDQVGAAGLDAPSAAAVRRSLIARGRDEAADVRDLSHSLDLVETDLERGVDGSERNSDWYRNVGQIVIGLRLDMTVVDRTLGRLSNQEMPAQERRTVTHGLRSRLQALLIGRDLDEDGRVDPRRDVAGLLQLRDALNYAAVSDGEDWNCREQPEPAKTVLAAYRQDVLWCPAKPPLQEIPQS